MSTRTTSVLDEALRFLAEEVRPVAEAIDQDTEQLRALLKRMGELKLLALKRPTEYGGPEISEPEFRVFQEEMARRSGTLAFLQTQHQSAVSMLSKSSNEALKARLLPGTADGTVGIGIGFSQLRRSGPPLMKATPVPGGYQLDGHVPWVTGWTFFDQFLIGATLPDGEALFAVVPLVAQPGIEISEPMRLAAMGAALTVTVDFSGWFVPSSEVAFVRPTGWIHHNDMINIALQGSFAMGCAQAGIDIVEAAGEKKALAFLHESAAILRTELAAIKAKALELQADVSEETTPERLQLRAWQIEFAVRSAHAAVIASSGAANYLSNPAQRVYREALVFSVSAQTTAIMEASLARLLR